jgi:hypothetical protein
MGVYQDCYEDVAQFYVEFNSDHLSCYLRYTE